MSEPDPAPQEPKFEQLSYATPVPSERGHPLMVVLGVVIAGICWPIATFASAALFTSLFPQVNSRAAPISAGIILFIIGGTAVVLLFTREKRRFLVLGWLVGTAIVALLQGICFVSIS